MMMIQTAQRTATAVEQTTASLYVRSFIMESRLYYGEDDEKDHSTGEEGVTSDEFVSSGHLPKCREVVRHRDISHQ